MGQRKWQSIPKAAYTGTMQLTTSREWRTDGRGLTLEVLLKSGVGPVSNRREAPHLQHIFGSCSQSKRRERKSC